MCCGYLGKLIGSKFLIERDNDGWIVDSDSNYYYLSGASFIIGLLSTLYMLDIMKTKSMVKSR